MSGKDRNGVCNNHKTVLAVSRELRPDIGCDRGVAEAVVGGGHQAYLAGAGGGTTCCFGIKKDSRKDIPKDYKDLPLYRASANTNKFKSKPEKAYLYPGEIQQSWQDRTQGQAVEQNLERG
jgi:hypothetical protein